MNDMTEQAATIAADEIIKRVERHINLSPEQEELLERAILTITTQGVAYAWQVVKAMRARHHGDAA